MPLDPSFLDEIEAEYHQDLLERGNLKPRQREAPFTPQWRFEGCYARISLWVCACGSQNRRLEGIFARDVSLSGATREKALPLSTCTPPSHIVQTVLVPACAECFPLGPKAT